MSCENHCYELVKHHLKTEKAGRIRQTKVNMEIYIYNMGALSFFISIVVHCYHHITQTIVVMYSEWSYHHQQCYCVLLYYYHCKNLWLGCSKHSKRCPFQQTRSLSHMQANDSFRIRNEMNSRDHPGPSPSGMHCLQTRWWESQLNRPWLEKTAELANCKNTQSLEVTNEISHQTWPDIFLRIRFCIQLPTVWYLWILCSSW